MKNPQTSALYIFPTKALTNDQKQSLVALAAGTRQDANDRSISISIYDGDTPRHERTQIRTHPGLLLTNPDMLHMGILPHHTLWAEYFRSLRYVVIDEMHMYRGVFGSHVANLIRRFETNRQLLRRLPAIYPHLRDHCQPEELAQRLIEAPVTVVDGDGSTPRETPPSSLQPAHRQRELGIRRSAAAESLRSHR